MIQFLATAVQGANFLLPVVPEKYKVWVAFTAGLAQAASGLIAHYFNPDGTPAKVAYLEAAKTP